MSGKHENCSAALLALTSIGPYSLRRAIEALQAVPYSDTSPDEWDTHDRVKEAIFQLGYVTTYLSAAMQHLAHAAEVDPEEKDPDIADMASAFDALATAMQEWHEGFASPAIPRLPDTGGA